MESFYGGRHGTPFIIVQRFDGIDIPENTIHRGAYYAVNTDSTKLYIDNNKPIIKDAANFDKYNWKYFKHDGKTIVNSISIKDGSIGTYIFEEEYAKGMVQCFSKGNDTCNEVNYGEYVIIDTIVGCNKFNDPDNGKVYRRGMDLGTSLAGAEYIGQIVGPQGECPELTIDTEASVKEYSPHFTKSYTISNKSLVPGWNGNRQSPVYKDAITYSYATIKDEFGNVHGCILGFTFPYMVLDFSSVSVEPYKNGVSADTSEITRIDDKTHPYFESWRLSVPKGIKGDTFRNLRVVFDFIYGGVPAKKNSETGTNTTLSEKAIIKDHFYYYSSAPTFSTTLDKIPVAVQNIMPDKVKQNYTKGITQDTWVEVLVWNSTTKQFEQPDIPTFVQLKYAHPSLYYEKYVYDNKQDGEYITTYLGPYTIIDAESVVAINNNEESSKKTLVNNGLWLKKEAFAVVV